MENDKNSHDAALELTDKLVNFLEKQKAPKAVAFQAVLYVLASTIASLGDPKGTAELASKELPRLVAVADRALAKKIN
jgi:hypothetical protein